MAAQGESHYPFAPRLLAGVGAVAVAVYFSFNSVALAQHGLPWTAYALGGAAVPLVLFLAILALAPSALQRVLRRVSRVDLRDGGHVAALVVMACTLFFVFGYGALSNGVYAYETAYPHGAAPAEIGPYDAPALNATAQNSTVALNWSSVAGAERYHVYRGAAGHERELVVVNATGYVDDSAVAGTAWSYRVAAEGPLGLGRASAAQAVELPEEASSLFSGLVLNIIVLVLPAVLFVGFVHGGGPGGAMRALGLGLEGAGRRILIGFAAAVAFLLLLELAVTLAGQARLDAGDNERALSIARSVASIGSTAWLGALAVAALSAFSEEVFFRGFLQPRVGIFGSAVLFAAAHANYVNVLEIVVVFALAIVLSLLLRFTKSLWAPIATHFLFNLLMLLSAVYAPQLAQ